MICFSGRALLSAELAEKIDVESGLLSVYSYLDYIDCSQGNYYTYYCLSTGILFYRGSLA